MPVQIYETFTGRRKRAVRVVSPVAKREVLRLGDRGAAGPCQRGLWTSPVGTCPLLQPSDVQQEGHSLSSTARERQWRTVGARKTPVAYSFMS